MALDWQPGMKMFQAEWLREGEPVGTYTVHALDEADTLHRAEEFFLEHPEHDITGGREGTTVRVGRVVQRDGRHEVIFSA